MRIPCSRERMAGRKWYKIALHSRQRVRMMERHVLNLTGDYMTKMGANSTAATYLINEDEDYIYLRMAMNLTKEERRGRKRGFDHVLEPMSFR